MATDWLLTQNDRMKKQGIFNWTLPAWAVRLEDQNPDGTTTVRNINVCPQASICASGIAALIVSHGAVSLCRRVVARLSSVPMSFIVSLSVPLVWPRSRSLAGLLVVCPLEDPRRELPCLGMVISGGGQPARLELADFFARFEPPAADEDAIVYDGEEDALLAALDRVRTSPCPRRDDSSEGHRRTGTARRVRRH